MRVLLVTPWFPSAQAPQSGIFVLRDATALQSGHEVRVLHLDSGSGALERAGEDAVEGVPVLRVPFRRGRLGDWRRVRRAIREASAEADVVHTHALSGLLPFALGRLVGGRWVHTEHWSGVTAPETLTRAGRAARRALMPLLARPDVVIVACERLTLAIRTVRKGPIATVPCVVAAPPEIVEPPREPGVLRVIGVGGIIPRKGPLCALESIAELRRRGMDARLTWVGDGPQRAELLARAHRLGLSDRLTLTGGLSEEQVGEQLDRHDVFLLPTLGDNFCIVVAEALSHGRPVVSGADTGAVDYSAPEVSRFVRDDRDPLAYADAMQDLVAATGGMTAEEIADTVRGRFTPERVAALLSEVYAGG